MLCRALVSGGHLQAASGHPTGGRATICPSGNRAAEKPRGNGDLRQAGEGAFFARAGLGAVAHEAAFVRVRAGDVGGIEQGVGVLSVHEVDEQLAKRFAAGDEFARRCFERGPGGRRCQGGFKPSHAGGGQLARVEQFFDREHFVAGLCAARQIRDPRRLECAGGAAAGGAKLGVVIGDVDIEQRRAGRFELFDDAVHFGRDFAFAGDADEPLPQDADAPAFERGGVQALRRTSR